MLTMRSESAPESLRLHAVPFTPCTVLNGKPNRPDLICCCELEQASYVLATAAAANATQICR